MAGFGPMNRSADQIITDFTDTMLTEGEFRQLITDSINRVGDNCDILIRDKIFELTGDTTGTMTVTGGFTEGAGAQTITIPTEISAMAVGTAELANDSVTSAKIVDGTIVAGDIANGAVTNLKLADDAVTSAKILDGTIVSGDIAANTITDANIAENAVGASELADDAVDTAAIADGAVTSAKIAANTITADDIAPNAVGASELANNAVDTAAIADDAVTAAKLADNLVRTESVMHSSTMPASLSMSVPFYSVHLDPSGTGTIITTVPVGMFDGQTINITATRGMTITWSGTTPAISRGIGLATSARIASGIWSCLLYTSPTPRD